MQQKQINLKNGLKVLFIKENTDVASLGLSVGAGAYFESDDNSGISHLLEHLISRSDISREDFRTQIYKNGGIFEASTSVFKTYFYLSCLSSSFDRLSNLFVEGIFKPKFNNDDLKDSKHSVVSELSYMEDAEPYRILRQMMWKDKNLSKPIVGSKDSILSLDLEDINNYHHKFYNANNVSIVLLARDLPEEFLKVLQRLPSNNKNSIDEISLDLNPPAYRVLQERNYKSEIVLSFPTKGFEGMGEGRHYFNLAAGALSQFYLSELGSKGLIYDESWVWNIFPKNGDLVLFLDDVDRKHLLPTLKGLTNIIDRWTQIPMDVREFEIMKNHKILDLKTHTSLSEKIVLLTKGFSSSEEVHTYDEAIMVYENARLDIVLEYFNSTLLSKKPYIVVSCGMDLESEVEEVEKTLKDYFNN